MDKVFRREILDKALGFPIRLINVPNGDLSLANLKHMEFSRDILQALALKPARLLGSEIKYIRAQFDMNQQAFAKRFSCSHADVVGWERAENSAAAINWLIEKDIRLFILQKLGCSGVEFLNHYTAFESEPKGRITPLLLDLSAKVS